VDVAATGEGVTLFGSDPLSGTSYSAPVVSGLAALIRARFPTWTARQVMQRIESTAHHPPAGWDPFVGNGTVDALAAVSTDWTSASTSTPRTPPVAISPPPPRPPDGHVRATALRGVAIGMAALVLALASSRLRGPRGPRDTVPGD
jgi:membrane-anchored mycosin MYCP